MKNIILLCVLLISFISTHFAQQIPPKREFRSVWIASVNNIDWPSQKNLHPTLQKAQFITILNHHHANKMNAVVVQIRPSCDAFYISDIEPWSEWLTGAQGTPPSPLYDPLEFMLEETKKRGMEFHAWFNPYRAVVSVSGSSVHSSHISITHPHWIKQYGNIKILDPGLPQVREYVTNVIIDVVRRYDIDGVHFDDYFYPYPISGVPFDDDGTFAQYPNGFTDKGDWRRNNVNLLLEMINDSIKAVKPHVKFGISPFGIWRNLSQDPIGSATSGLSAYDAIYADARAWLMGGYIDYVTPQIYWNIGYPPARFEVLVPWWINNSFGRHFYVGHAAYKINSSNAIIQDPKWAEPSQMPDQLKLIRLYPGVHGSTFFSSKSVTNNPLGFQDSLRSNYYKYPSLIPPMLWLDSIPPLKPVNLNAMVESNGVLLTWNLPEPAVDGDLPKYFIVYRFDSEEEINIDDPRSIRFISVDDTTNYFDIFVPDSSISYAYVVTSLDRLHNESEPSVFVINLTGTNKEVNKPVHFILEQNYPNPFNPVTKIKYSIPALHNPLQGRAMGGLVTLKVYDILGNEITTLLNETKQPGTYEVEFNAEGLPSGVYYYQLKSGSFFETKKMVVLK